MKPKDEEKIEKPEIHIPKENIIKGEHTFDYISGTEVMCRKCPLGYIVGPEEHIKDGHIYKGEILLV